MSTYKNRESYEQSPERKESKRRSKEKYLKTEKGKEVVRRYRAARERRLRGERRGSDGKPPMSTNKEYMAGYREGLKDRWW